MSKSYSLDKTVHADAPTERYGHIESTPSVREGEITFDAPERNSNDNASCDKGQVSAASMSHVTPVMTSSRPADTSTCISPGPHGTVNPVFELGSQECADYVSEYNLLIII